MKRCRCCRQTWTHGSFRRGHNRCYACEVNCGIHRRRRAVEKTRAWKANLRAQVMAVRSVRAA